MAENYLKAELYLRVRESEDVFAFFEHGCLDGVWYWDLENPEQEWMSPEFKALFGYEDHEVPNTSAWWQENIFAEDLPGVLETYRRHVEEDEPYDQVVRYRHKDGSTVWVRCRGLAIRNSEGTPIRMLGAHTDMTALMRVREELGEANTELERRVAARTRDLEVSRGAAVRALEEAQRAREETESTQEQLVQAQKMEAVGRLAGGIAHDFNNQLTGVLGFAEFALRKLEPEHPAYEDIELIRSAGTRAAELTRQLLAFSRKQILSPRTVDLNLLVKAAKTLLRRVLTEELNVRIVTGTAPATVHLDPNQMEQAILNLTINARDAMQAGGTLTIEVTHELLDQAYALTHPEVTPGPHVCLMISDTGDGMDADTRARAFEPFFTTKGVGKGTGLGLAMVHGFVKQSGGHVWLYSEPGKGTTFRLYFPLDAGTVEPPPPPESGALPKKSAGQVILVVEDDDLVRAVVVRALEDSGYRVLQAPSAEAALSLLEASTATPHLVITDVVMPGMSGRDLAEQLQKQLPGVRVLYMSGFAENAIVHHGVLDPDVQFVSKPIVPKVLLERVLQIFESPGR